ncbi:MAG: hypothetical protein EA392_01500 [Cryomorphaceae bacterium]|nr:MAG: hypothetical protein EA392_01500 [Cryomorphaceae bacterium]
MYIKLDISWQGRKAGDTIKVDDKHYPFIIQNKIGTKVKQPDYETKEEKKAPTRSRKKKADATDNNENN